jgi:exopolysaccharide biosynthesis polyprenyl glycosylphosphotransferase
MGVNTPKTWLNYLQMFGDFIILNATIAAAFTIWSDWKYFFAYTELYVMGLLFLSILTIFLFNFYGLYATANKDWTNILPGTIVSIVFLSIAIISMHYAIPSYVFPRRALFAFVMTFTPNILLWRWYLLKMEQRIAPRRKTIIIANRNEINELVSKLHEKDDLLGVITDKPSKRETPYHVLGTYEHVSEILATRRPQVILLTGSVPEETKSSVALICLRYNCILYVVPNLYEIMVAQSKLDQFQDTPVFQIMFHKQPGKDQFKRVIDCVLAVSVLLVTLPITLITALIIKLTSPGAVFFVQERVGRRNKSFMLYKFRTMIHDAEKETGPVLSSLQDTRVTKVGKFLRLTRIDELPQFINVLKGDMSIVGPRPERPCFVEKFDKEVPGYSYRHVANAGITGLAQIAGKYSTSPQDKLRYDLLYAKGASPLFDLSIMFHTIKVIIQKDKAS